MNDAVQDDEHPAEEAAEELAEAPRRGRLALTVAAVLAVLAIGFVWVLATGGDSTDRLGYTHLQGKEAPPVAGESLLTGEAFDIEDYRGQWVVVNFFATWCVPCIQEHPELVAFDEDHRALGDAAMASVVFDDDLDKVTDFFETQGGDFPVIPDPDGQIAVDYGVIKVPESYLVDPEGIVRRKIIGGVTQGGLDRAIASLESETEGAESS